MKKVLLISLLNEKSPALRYRVTMPMGLLQEEEKIVYDEIYFYSEKTSSAMDGSDTVLKLKCVIKDFFKFINRIIKCKKNYDVVIVKSYIFPFFGSFLERLIYNKFKKSKILYDIDDAIYMNKTRKNNEFVSKFRNARDKVGFWYKNSDVLMVSNRFIINDLKQIYNYDSKEIVEFLSCPLANQYFKDDKQIISYKKQETTNFIWLGSPHTQENLRIIANMITQLPNVVKNPRVFLIGAHKDFELFRDLDYVEFIDWTPDSEEKYMRISHVGLNPLVDDEFERRKSAFKVIQYYRAGIIPIVSDVGINRELIEKYGGYCTDIYDMEGISSFIDSIKDNDYLGCDLYNKTTELTLEYNKEKIYNAM